MDDRREVIELVNKLQGYQTTTGCDIQIDLPQIVVVGAQSSGKSSVLDGLIGSSILPRGSGTVTKCPIIVQLITTPDPDQAGVEFQDAPSEGRIQDMDIVREKISERMEMDEGTIKDDPIIIKVYSPNVVTLTVVDLPGIKRLTTSGEPDNLEQLIFDLSRRYIKEKNAIILAVSPANYDICNSDGILLAKEADPEGDRTIGVLTKLDLMDEGTNARSLLTATSKDVSVKLGMIGLVNRSQKDIDNNFTVEAQIKKEKAFLSQNYPDLADRNGTPYLRKRLHELLVHHILKCLPEIQTNMEKLLEECQNNIDAVPDVATGTEKFRFVNKIIQGFENRMRREIEGSTRNPEYKFLYGGIRIRDIFEKEFAEAMENVGSRSYDSVNNEMIVNAFRNSGAFDSFFMYPEAVFRRLAQEQIKHIERPATQCADKVHNEILKVADRFFREEKDSFSLFPEFRKSIMSVVYGMLENKLESVKLQIKEYIRTQASVIFSLDNMFLEKVADVRRKLDKSLHSDKEESVALAEGKNPAAFVFGQGASPPPSFSKFAFSAGDDDLRRRKRRTEGMLAKLRDPHITQLIKHMVALYFQHVKIQIQDYIPKLIADRLITQFSSEEEGCLGTELRVHIMPNYEELVALPNNISEVREKNVKSKQHLKEVIGEIKALLDSHKYDEQVIDSNSEYSDNEN